jgi:hypothetical protein
MFQGACIECCCPHAIPHLLLSADIDNAARVSDVLPFSYSCRHRHELASIKSPSWSFSTHHHHSLPLRFPHPHLLPMDLHDSRRNFSLLPPGDAGSETGMHLPTDDGVLQFAMTMGPAMSNALCVVLRTGSTRECQTQPFSNPGSASAAVTGPSICHLSDIRISSKSYFRTHVSHASLLSSVLYSTIVYGSEYSMSDADMAFVFSQLLAVSSFVIIYIGITTHSPSHPLE